MKQTKQILLLAALLLGTLTASAHDFVKNGIYYRRNNNDVSDPTVAVTYMGSFSDSYKNEYTGHVSIPSTVTHRGTTYRVTEINSYAFEDCDKLTSIYIPSSITEIGVDAFDYCYGLKKVVFEDGNETLSMGHNKVGWQYGNSHGLFYHCPIESIYLGRNLSYSYLPFENSKTLKSVTIGKKVTSIGKFAFSGCSSLTSITIPENVTSIGDNAFNGCCFTSVKCPEQFRDLFTIVTAVGDFMFRVKDKVLLGYKGTSDVIELPKDFQGNQYAIGDRAFENCSTLTAITFSEGVTSIGKFAFSGCSSLTSITIPENSQLTSIGSGAFRNCSSLKQMTIPYALFEAVKINVDNNGGIIFKFHSEFHFERSSGTLYLKKYIGTDKNVVLPDNWKDERYEIGSFAFKNCSTLTSVTIPEGVTSIGDEAFSGCSTLTSVTIPEGVTSIGDEAFSGCYSLTSITLPESVTSIGDDAFRGCINLSSINIPQNVTSIGGSTFSGCIRLASVSIPKSVKTIGKHAFAGCTGKLIVNCDIPSKAFEECKFVEVVVGEEVKNIGRFAFSKCCSLTSVTFSENSQLTDIVDHAFDGCSSLTSITIPASVTSIGLYAFDGCSSLTAINIPEGVTSIGGSAFYNCSSLASITIPENVTRIGEKAFYGCTSLTTVIAHKSWKKIFKENRDKYFPNCSNLKKITYVK